MAEQNERTKVKITNRDEKRKRYWLKQLKSGKGQLTKPSIDLTTENHSKKAKENPETQDNKRYILFIGNLPFSATKDDVLTHFQRKGIEVADIRMLTKKGTEEPRGCCFMELGNAKYQQIALKFHQTKFKGRRINIEVTCGGGGSGENRRQRIKQKNQKFLDNLKIRTTSKK